MNESIFEREVEKIKTPCYVVELEKFEKNIEDIQMAFKRAWGRNTRIGYSIKTNHLPFLISYVKKYNFYAEAVSNEEYDYASSQGYELKDIIFNGPQKEYSTLRKAILGGSLVNLDNFQGVEMVEKIGREIGYENIEVGLRFNFDLESVCRGETDLKDGLSRFGLCLENDEFGKALTYLIEKGCRVSGLHVHYTTRTRSLDVYRAISNKVVEVILKYGLKKTLKYIDLGGGFWGGREVRGKPSMEQYSSTIAEILKKHVSPREVQLILEPGSALLSTVAFYMTSVINTKDIRGQRIVTVDGSILDVNPFMRKRNFEFSVGLGKHSLIDSQIVCGSTCLENDRIMYLENHRELVIGDKLKIHNAGAYTISFNDYFINSPPYVYLKEKDKYTMIRDK